MTGLQPNESSDILSTRKEKGKGLITSNVETSAEGGVQTIRRRVNSDVKGSTENSGRRDVTSNEPPNSKQFAPTVVLDGSKIIMRLARNDTFTLDNASKLLLSTPNIRLERSVAWQTTGTCSESDSTGMKYDIHNQVVIDCGLLGHRFIPIPLSHYGTVYTKDGTVHVTVGDGIRRIKVHSRNLPYRTCNKFHAISILESELEDESAASNVAGWFLERQSTNKLLSSIDPSQALKFIKQMTSDTHSSVLYIRADDSLIRYKLRHNEKIDLHAGRVIAWTVGVRFEQSNYCCFRFATAVHGEGTVWIQNSRPRGVSSSV